MASDETFNLGVLGSIPSRPTKSLEKINTLQSIRE